MPAQNAVLNDDPGRGEALKPLLSHPRVRVWFPEVVGAKGGIVTNPQIHTKAMAIDDAAITVGSANLNPRSMDAKVDTEINLTILALTRKELSDAFDWCAANKFGLTFDIDTDDMGEKPLDVAKDVL